MRLKQPDWNGVLREGGRTSALPGALRQARHLARSALDYGTELPVTAPGRFHPGPVLPGRPMTDVLRVPAREISDPVSVGILVKASDDGRARHCVWRDRSLRARAVRRFRVESAQFSHARVGETQEIPPSSSPVQSWQS
jgi:hypothetical protein